MKNNWNVMSEMKEKEKTRKIIRKILLKIETDRKNNILDRQYKNHKKIDLN